MYLFSEVVVCGKGSRFGGGLSFFPKFSAGVYPENFFGDFFLRHNGSIRSLVRQILILNPFRYISLPRPFKTDFRQ